MKKEIPDLEVLKYHGTEEKPDIKIFVSHRIDKDSTTIDNPIFVPVRCGAVFDERSNVDILGDDTGDNISYKRLQYCELTVHYWAWKNVDADYYGLCHYRRFNSFSETEYEDADDTNMVSEKHINEGFIKKYNLLYEEMVDTIKNYDIVAVKPLNLKNMTIYESLVNNSPVFDMRVVDKFISTIKELYPSMEQDVDSFFAGNEWRGFNCYIMTKKIFNEYSSMLFDVLFSVEKDMNFDCCNQEQLRTIGYMGEAFWGIFVNNIKSNQDVRILETQIAKVENVGKKVVIDPVFEKNFVPIVVASSNEYVPITSVLLTSIVENSASNTNYDIIILTLDITDVNKAILKEMFSSHSNFSLRFIDAHSFLAGRKLHTALHVTPMTYLRLAILDIMEKYKKVIYLDCDIVVNCDLLELYEMDMENFYVAAARDSIMAGWSNYGSNEEEENVEYNLNIVGIKSRFDYFNGGVLCINLDAIRENYSSQQLFDIAESRKWKWFDQDVLNKISVGKVKWLDGSWNVLVHQHNAENEISEFYSPYKMYQEYIKARKNPRIIHYAGRVIPCFCPYVDDAEYFWNYARKSPYYEKLLAALSASTAGIPPKRKKLLIYRVIEYIHKYGKKKCILHILRILGGKDSFM